MLLVLCKRFLHIRIVFTTARLWRTLVEKSVDNVENCGFSTVISPFAFSPASPQSVHKWLNNPLRFSLCNRITATVYCSGFSQKSKTMVSFCRRFPLRFCRRKRVPAAKFVNIRQWSVSVFRMKPKAWEILKKVKLNDTEEPQCRER